LGIPAFKLDLPAPKKQIKHIHVSSIEDLPRFIESGEFTNRAGIKLITKFLAEEDEDLKSAGGCFD